MKTIIMFVVAMIYHEFYSKKVTVARLYFHVGCHHDFYGQLQVVVHMFRKFFGRLYHL